MPVVIACPLCQQKIRVNTGLLGKSVKCPQCKNPFTAVDPNAVAPPAPTWEPVTEKPDLSFAPPRPQEPPEQDFNYDQDVPVERPLPRKPGTSAFVDYLLFRRMVTPAILTVIFYLIVAVEVIGGIVYGVIGLITLFAGSAILGLASVVAAFVGTIIAVLYTRIACEIILVLFRILDNVRQVNERLEQGVMTQESESEEPV